MPRVDVLCPSLLKVKQSYLSRLIILVNRPPSPPPNGSSLALHPHTPSVVAALPRASDWMFGQTWMLPRR
jgi:hypothetical protein